MFWYFILAFVCHLYIHHWKIIFFILYVYVFLQFILIVHILFYCYFIIIRYQKRIATQIKLSLSWNRLLFMYSIGSCIPEVTILYIIIESSNMIWLPRMVQILVMLFMDLQFNTILPIKWQYCLVQIYTDNLQYKVNTQNSLKGFVLFLSQSPINLGIQQCTGTGIFRPILSMLFYWSI